MKCEAFCPAHVTGFFKAELENSENQKPENMGSLGAGFSIQEGVTTTVNVKPFQNEKSKFQIKISGYESDNLQVSKFVINEFMKLVPEDNNFIDVHHKITVPVGYGLGCSSAVALSLALALNQALDTKLTKTKISAIAHVAEICC